MLRLVGTNLVLQADHPIRSPGRVRTPFIAPIDDTGNVAVDLNQGDYIVIDTQVGGVAAVQNPTGGGGVGQDIAFLLQNWSTNPFSLTWGSAYRLDPSFGGPGPNKLKVITFIRIGNVWVQQSATPDL